MERVDGKTISHLEREKGDDDEKVEEEEEEEEE